MLTSSNQSLRIPASMAWYAAPVGSHSAVSITKIPCLRARRRKSTRFATYAGEISPVLMFALHPCAHVVLRKTRTTLYPEAAMRASAASARAAS